MIKQIFVDFATFVKPCGWRARTGAATLLKKVRVPNRPKVPSDWGSVMGGCENREYITQFFSGFPCDPSSFSVKIPNTEHPTSQARETLAVALAHPRPSLSTGRTQEPFVLAMFLKRFKNIARTSIFENPCSGEDSNPSLEVSSTEESRARIPSKNRGMRIPL